jgi:hypothetical protein
MAEKKWKLPTHPKKIGTFKIGDLILYQGKSYKIEEFTKHSDDNIHVSIVGQGMHGGCSIQQIVHDTPENREIARLMLIQWKKLYEFPLSGLNYPRISDRFSDFFAQICNDPQHDLKKFDQFVDRAYQLCEQAKAMEVDGIKIFC